MKAFVLILGFAVIWFFLGAGPKRAAEVNNPALLNTTDYLVIEKLSLRIPIVYLASREEKDIQNGLQNGVVHIKDTAEAGEIGNSYIVGHSSDFASVQGNYKEVFAKLPELKIGDEIAVETENSRMIFSVIGTKIVEADDLSVLSQNTGGQKLITLQTSYPIGTARQRYIVVAKLVSN